MVFQLLAIVLGIVGLALFYAGGPASLPVVVVALVLFVAVDLFGLVTARLACGPGVLLPVLPAIFVRPWPVGLLWGFLVFALIDVAVSAARFRAGQR